MVCRTVVKFDLDSGRASGLSVAIVTQDVQRSDGFYEYVELLFAFACHGFSTRGILLWCWVPTSKFAVLRTKTEASCTCFPSSDRLRQSAATSLIGFLVSWRNTENGLTRLGGGLITSAHDVCH